MGEEYTWLVGLDDVDEEIKAIKCTFEIQEEENDNCEDWKINDEREFCEGDREEDQAVIVNTVRSEDISEDLFSAYLNLQASLSVDERKLKVEETYLHFDEISTIEPYVDPTTQTSGINSTATTTASNDSHVASFSSAGATHSMLTVSHPKSSYDIMTSTSNNIIQIGDRIYTVTSELFDSLKVYLCDTMQGAEIMSAISSHSEVAGQIVSQSIVSGAVMVQQLASVRVILAMIKETCHFTLDRTQLYTKWYTTSIISDDPEMAHRKSIRNTASLSRPDCATTSLTLNSAIVKRRAHFSTISWMDRQLLWVTRDDIDGSSSSYQKTASSRRHLISDSSYSVSDVSHGDDSNSSHFSSTSNSTQPVFHHCQSIYEKSPSQAIFRTNDAYDPSSNSARDQRRGAVTRPTAAATANYWVLLDALMASAFNHKQSPGSAEAYAILVDMITPPEFEEKTSCAECFELFSMTTFRHHCRNCGRSVCRRCCSSTNRRIPKYGYTDPVRVCFACAHKLDVEAMMDRVQWRLLRIKDFLSDQLIPFFSHGVDRGIDKVSRVVDMSLFILKSALMCNYPAFLIVETVDILKRYGMSGLAGVLMRQDFVEAAETLKKISGMDKHYPISLSELTACIYYRLAIERGIRGTDPDGEHRLHYPSGQEPGDAPYCTPVALESLEAIIDYSSMALMVVYETSAIECQRIAKTQGYACICAETVSEPERPAFGIYVSDKKESACSDTPPGRHRSHSSSSEKNDSADYKMHRSRSKEVILTIRGTLSIHDVVTDIRAAPHPFPPSQEEILSLIYQGHDVQVEGVAKPSNSSKTNFANEESDGRMKSSMLDSESEEEGDEEETPKSLVSDNLEKDDWEWLLTSDTKTYACTGIFRSACWLLSEVGKPLLELMNQGYRLIICGHSLGAAVASLVAYMLHDVGVSNLHCYAYAPPSFVDEATSDKMQPFVTTIILHDDIIPRVTPQSIRFLMKDVLFFRSEVFKYLEQDWKDAIARAAAIWAPRTRDADMVHTRGGATASERMEVLQESKSYITLDKDCDVATEEDVGEDHVSQYLLVLEEDVIPLWLPGRIVHIYSRNGVYDAAYVPRTFPQLRRIIVQGNIFRDHGGQSIFEALQEIRAAKTSSCSPPPWAPYNDPSTQGVCKCCKSRFTWHSTFRGEAQEYKERYNCRSCGGLVCGPCSTNRQPILRLGLINPSRICDTCFYNGIYSSDRNP